MSATAAAMSRGEARPGLARLTAVELRKMTDTRAGFWLLAATAGLTALTVVIGCLALDEADRNLRELLALALQPGAILLPVIGILLVTSEWSQRTALITFALVPDRSRVLAAKVAAGLVLGLIAFQIALVCAALGTAASGAEWQLSAAVAGQSLLYVLASMLVGLAFGAALLASAPAIVAYFALPIVWGAVDSVFDLGGPADWLDSGRTMAPLVEHALSGTEWAQLGTSLVLWLALPLAVGAWRIGRTDVR